MKKSIVIDMAKWLTDAATTCVFSFEDPCDYGVGCCCLEPFSNPPLEMSAQTNYRRHDNEPIASAEKGSHPSPMLTVD